MTGGYEPVLQIRDVAKSYGDHQALDSVSLDIAPGEILALLGANGAGKSTLVSIVAGLLDPDAGQVQVCGFDVVAQRRTATARLGLAPQELAVYPRLTVRENIEFFAVLAGLAGRTKAARCAQAAERLDLGELLGRRAAHLSGGEKRRLHTALAVVHRPPLLLLDEPTAGVDTQTRLRLLEFVRELADEGAAICYTTHYLPEVETLGASVAVIHRGRIRERGSQEALISAHTSPTVEVTFAGAAPRPRLAGLPGIEVAAEGSVLRLRGGETRAVMAALMSELDGDAARIRDLTIRQPSLEAAYLVITGEPPSPGEAGGGPDGTDLGVPVVTAAAPVPQEVG